VNEPKDDEKLLLGYIKKKDFEQLEGKTAFIFMPATSRIILLVSLMRCMMLPV
jgi:hypothetical protein